MGFYLEIGIWLKIFQICLLLVREFPGLISSEELVCEHCSNLSEQFLGLVFGKMGITGFSSDV